jgi:hypothetical protein
MTEINLIYEAHKGNPSLRYDGPEGRVWTSAGRRKSMHNVAMSYLSAKDRKPTDSIWVLEPRCVHDRDYDVSFLKQFKYIFTWGAKAFQGTQIAHKVIPVNHSSCKGTPGPDEVKKKWKPWSKRKDQIVIIANKKISRHPSEIYRLRIKLADWLHENCKYEVLWYGNPPKSKPYSRGKIPDKFPVLNNVKFSICPENCYHPKFSHGYFTEKMPQVWFAGAVPIYMGCYNIDDFNFGPNSYIDLRKFVNKEDKELHIAFGKLKKVIEGYDEDAYKRTIKELEESLRKPDGLYHVISDKRIFQKMFEMLSK